MASMTSRKTFLCLGLFVAITAAVGACASPAVVECGNTGVLCPSGTHCAAAQGICLPDTNTCGDAHLDPGEVCDDGNTLDGDGCSRDCLSDETCGNGITDLSRHEVCDDKNNVDGDGCSHDCLSLETCGNGIVDKGEACDDGNNRDGDGCSHDCLSNERCGNGITDDAVGEVCDPPVPGSCGPDCKSLLQCGNGIIDRGEECDDGQTNNGPDKDCRADCVLNRCGDGFANTHGVLNHEDCDGAIPALANIRTAVPTETAECNSDCTAAACGDGKVNHSFIPRGASGPEQCDNAGSNHDDADCTLHCQLSVCGDRLTNLRGPLHVEACDFGNPSTDPSCTNACASSTCGDGIVQPGRGEECDLGTGVNADNGACTLMCKLAKCGDGKVELHVEECDTNDVGGVHCSDTCHLQTCGNGIIDPGEECDNGTTGTIHNDDHADCRSDCIINRCGDGYQNTIGTHHEACDAAPQVAHGNPTVTPTESAACNINCTAPACGDGIVNHLFIPLTLGATPVPGPGPEQCDDGARVDGDSCSSDCRLERCGNNVIDPGEECDGAPVGGKTCSANCKLQTCGNAILDPGEECDNGIAGNGNDKDCRTDCVINRCGDGFPNLHGVHNVEACDGGPLAGLGIRTAIPTDKPNCNSNCTEPSCGDGIVNNQFPVPPAMLTEQCDPPGPGCSAICRLQTCGNGVVDGNEQCDDGNPNDGDACEKDCTLPRCGNGITDAGEECDDGNSINTDGCTNACQNAGCGDGFVEAGVEDCDDPTHATSCVYIATQTACHVCDPLTCQDAIGTAHFCGDGHRDAPFEACDDGNATCGSCSPNCGTVTLASARGFIFAAAGEDLVAQTMTSPPNDTFQLSDGFSSRTFEFSTGTVTAPNIKIAFAPADTNATMATKIAGAINASTLQINASATLGIVTLDNTRLSSLGNGTVVSPRLTESVATANFAVLEMTGGAGGNCNVGTACASNEDCASHTCNTTTHLCQ
jgi:cysteine-rich repeat protein